MAFPVVLVVSAFILGLFAPDLFSPYRRGSRPDPPRIGPRTPLVVITPEPTHSVPPAIASDAARSQFAAIYGSFDPITRTGSSNEVIDLPKGAGAGLVTLNFDGSSSFHARVDNPPRGRAVAPVVGSVGPWHGTVLYSPGTRGIAPTTLTVDAGEPWTVRIDPVHTAPELKLPASGSGPGVYLYRGGAFDWDVKHVGSSNFIIKVYDVTGRASHPVNAIGNYEATVAAPEGAAIVSIEADGDWTIAEP